MGTRQRLQHMKYSEGQWFAVPLQTTGFGLGVIVRGNYRTKGGLGYFFCPKLTDLPIELDVSHIQPFEAILVTWFGDLHIVIGKWPLLKSTGSFQKDKWPVPKFARIDVLNPNKGWLVEYEQENPTFGRPLQTTRCDVSVLTGLPIDALSGAVSVEIKLTQLLESNKN